MSCASVNGSDDWVVDEMDYVREAQQTVYKYSHISIENALILNKQMRVHLNELKSELERLIDVCQQKYKKNEALIDDMNRAKNEPKRYSTYYFCGYPYFKDRQGGAPPQSAEYLRRAKKGDEIFPLDLEKRRVWLSRHKVEIVQGVKKQVISYLQTQNRAKIRKTVGKRFANELSTRIQNESDQLESLQLRELLKKIEGSDFSINWLKISMDDLEDRHTPNECKAIWYGYLMPTLNRSAWTPAEEDKLLNAAKDFNEQNWTEIAKAVENRSAYQCFVHYQTKFNKTNLPKNVRWTPEQDKHLLEFVAKYRIGNIIPWTKIMEKCPGRTKAQIYNRYMFSLNPEINHEPFTVEEDCILMAAIKEYGQNYREFPVNLLPGRNIRQMRERYSNVLRHVNVREHWSEDHDIKLMELVKQYGTSDWVKISEKMVSHSRTSCRQRYTTIKKFLDKNPKKCVSDVPRRKRAFSTNVTTDNWMEALIEAKNLESMNESSDDNFTNNSLSKRVKKLTTKTLQYNREFYDFFKYSFNFKFGDAIPASDALFENVQIACQILQAPTLPIHIDLCNPLFSSFVTMQNVCKKVQLESDLLKSLNQLGKNDFNYPINVNTILGLRGMSAMFGVSSENKKVSNAKQKNTSKSIKFEHHDALNLFRMRFNTIFKQTATLAKMRRSMTSVSLRLRNKKRSKQHQTTKSTATITSVAAANATTTTTTTTTDSHNNTILMNVAVDDNEFECYATSENEEKPNKRNQITVLESITLGLNESQKDEPLSQPSTSHAFYNCYRYRVEQSDAVSEISIQPYTSECESEIITDDQSTYSNADFVIWTPTITDDATGSTTPTESIKQKNSSYQS